MVDKDLQKILNPDDLFRVKLEVSITLSLETLPIGIIVYHSLDNFESHLRDILLSDPCIVVLIRLRQ